MNITCVICSELFTDPSDIQITQCGHLFHLRCLTQWIERSRTCPQCRNKCTEKTIRRVYVNLLNTEGIVDDLGSLQNKVDNLELEIKEQNEKVQDLVEEKRNVEEEKECLMVDKWELEKQVQSSNTVIINLKENISILKMKVKENSHLRQQVKTMGDKIKLLKSQEIVVTGSEDEVHHMLQHTSDPQSLVLLVKTLKKALSEAEQKRRSLESKLRNAQSMSSEQRKKALDASKEKAMLLKEIECHKNCETERKYLKRKIKEMEENAGHAGLSVADRSVQRILAESPAPLPKRPCIPGRNFNIGDSPCVQEKVEAIKESDSPYLHLKVNSLMPSTSGRSNKFSAVKDCAGTSGMSSKRFDHDVVYNGLGGHSKIERFEPRSRSDIVIKKPKSLLRVPSDKFKKLAPNNKKIDQFFM